LDGTGWENVNEKSQWAEKKFDLKLIKKKRSMGKKQTKDDDGAKDNAIVGEQCNCAKCCYCLQVEKGTKHYQEGDIWQWSGFLKGAGNRVEPWNASTRKI